MGFTADFRYELGTDIVQTASDIIVKVSREYPDSIVFAGQAVFRQPSLIPPAHA